MIKALFPSQIYYSSINEIQHITSDNGKILSPKIKQLIDQKTRTKLNKDLLIEVQKLRQVDELGIEWSKKNYPGGYTSYGSMDKLYQFSSTFSDLKDLIDQHVKEYIKYLEMEIPLHALEMTTCWVNVMPSSVTHSMHIHPLSTISGTYYLVTPPKCSSLKFEDPRMVNFMASPPRKKNAREENQRFVEVKPSSGNLVLFESWMRHEVPPNQSQSERISISFNYDWVK